MLQLAYAKQLTCQNELQHSVTIRTQLYCLPSHHSSYSTPAARASQETIGDNRLEACQLLMSYILAGQVLPVSVTCFERPNQVY